ncbi:hypothetical protein AXE80_10350 [Wenyingzhuangia fucanilytica]|uniref:histidine kinase n=1 Tax=Wenyingzhuangia fucanilytica TaxID=1790137 RepID=A0A1B1Y7A3_9FLAO|nr:hypothetical protein AXE80_10350 [Wenyingzhuangia fucanilytica]
MGIAQESRDFEKLSDEKGVAQSITYAVEQDSVGNIWIASEDGVIKYNSNFFKTYNKYNGIPAEIGNRANTVFIDSKNRVWMGGRRGVCLYLSDKDVFTKMTSENLIDPFIVRSITEDAYGDIWIAARNGVWKISETTTGFSFKREFDKISSDIVYPSSDKSILIGSESSIYKLDPQNKKYLQNTLTNNNIRVFSLLETTNGYLVGTGSDGLYKVDKNFQNFTPITFKGISLKGSAIRDLIKDDLGNYYVATDGEGVLYLNKNFKLLTHIDHSQDNIHSLSSNGVYDVMIDRENILWVATYGGGVNSWNNSKSVFKKITHKLNDKNSLYDNFTRAIATDENGKIWFGTKDGISIWDRKKNQWKNILLGKGVVLALESDGNDMWAGFYGEGLKKININTLKVKDYNTYNGVKFPIDKIYVIKKDLEGNIWVGGITSDLACITKDGEIRKFPIGGVRSILVKEDGDLILGNENGAFLLSIKDKAIAPISELKSDKNQYLIITSIIEYEKDKVLLTTNGSGIVFYDTKTKKVNFFDKSSGLPTDIIQAGIFWNQNEFWLSTAKGIVNVKIAQKDTIINTFDKLDGALSTEFNYGSYAKINNELFFGGTEGVVYFNPENVITKQHLPEIVFEEFRLFNQEQVPGQGVLTKQIDKVDQIKLTHSQNSIYFKFVGVLHNSPSKVKYSWRLEGFDDEWITPQKNNEVGYTNLNYGEYLFKVKAMNRFGKWGPERQIKIVIMAPWWATSQAYMLYFIVFILLLIVIVQLTKLSVNKKNADDQINFFNNLTHELKTPMAILLSSLESASREKNSGENANFQIKKTIKRLNSLFEQMLNFQKASTAGKIIQDISQIRLETYVQGLITSFKPLYQEKNITIELENNYLNEFVYFDKEIFNKIFYNLLSNAIKYTNDGGHIVIEFLERNKGKLTIRISDDGIGIPKDQQKYILKRNYRARNVVNSQKPGTGLGLMMIKSLIEKTGGTIAFSSEENKGTTFYIEIKDQFKEFLRNNANNADEFVEEKNVENDALTIKGLREFINTKILIVEDNNELRKVITTNLKPYFKIYEAANGKEGFDVAKKEIPDVIITDLIMPEVDGVELCKMLKADEDLTHIPVFMLTVLNSSSNKLESLESGVAEYLEKPVDIDILIAKIVNTLKYQLKLKEKYVHEGDVKIAIHSKNELDIEFIEKLEEIITVNMKDGSFSVNNLCESVGYSRTSLYVKLKELIDMSPQDFIIHTKLKHAKELLVKGGMSIKEVAYHSGFSNPKYFSTSFKKYFDTTPSGFLQSLNDPSGK